MNTGPPALNRTELKTLNEYSDVWKPNFSNPDLEERQKTRTYDNCAGDLLSSDQLSLTGDTHSSSGWWYTSTYPSERYESQLFT